MPIPVRPAAPLTTAEFLDWEALRPERYEFVGGVPVAMVGTSMAHNLICSNLNFALRAALRGRPCRVVQTEFKLRVSPDGNIRYPDIMVDCTGLSGSARWATTPELVAEVLSPSNTLADLASRYEDYSRVASIHTYLVIDQFRPGVVCYTRDAAGVLAQSWFGDTLEDVLHIDAWDIALPIEREDAVS
jgi:Uma2 family endonuclease